ncbi:hypothetical protein HYX01_04075 [Candidatus Woesearchaeota archaeon]|nr:hypothetical protein [Candidatus Woesearchaeota archaeon]
MEEKLVIEGVYQIDFDPLSNIIKKPFDHCGLEEFQTHDLPYHFGSGSGEYHFPGFVKERDFPSSNLRKETPFVIVTMYCRADRELRYARLYFERETEIFVTRGLETISMEGQSGTKFQGHEQTAFYDLSSLPNGQVRVVPNVEACIAHYQARAGEIQKKALDYRCREFLGGMNQPEVPTKEIVSFLEEKLKALDSQGYSNKLAEATRQYQKAEAELRHSRQCFEAALAVLYHYNPEQALNLIDASGVTTYVDFLDDQPRHEWFFLEDIPQSPEELGEYIRLGVKGLHGAWGGSNEVLHYLHDLRPPTKWDIMYGILRPHLEAYRDEEGSIDDFCKIWLSTYKNLAQ